MALTKVNSNSDNNYGLGGRTKKEDELLFLSMFPLDRYCSGCTSGQRIYNSNYGNVSLLLLSSWKVIIAENLIAVMGL